MATLREFIRTRALRKAKRHADRMEWECAACGKVYRGGHAHKVTENSDIACCGNCCVRVKEMVQEELEFENEMRLKEGLAP